MSQATLNDMIRAALMTRAEAIGANPQEDEAWSLQFAAAFQKHLSDEANRWLAEKGCAGFLRTGNPCPGRNMSAAIMVESDGWPMCDNCESAKIIRKLDSIAARTSQTAD